MRARLKYDYPLGKAIKACAGAIFVKDEWRDVAPDREAEARANPYLEIEPEAQPETKPARKGKAK